MEEEIKITTGLSKFKEFMIKLKKNNIVTKNLSECKNFVGKLKCGPEEGENWTRIGYAIESIPKIINKISGMMFVYLYLLFIAKGGYKNFVKNGFSAPDDKCTYFEFGEIPLKNVVYGLTCVFVVAAFLKIFKSNSRKMKIFAGILSIGLIVSFLAKLWFMKIAPTGYDCSYSVQMKYQNYINNSNLVLYMCLSLSVILVCIINHSIFWSWLRYYIGMPLLLGFLEVPGLYAKFIAVVLVIILVFAWIMDNMEDGSGSCVSVGDGKLSNKDIEMLRKLLKKLQSK